MRAYERFLKYVRVYTTSSETSETHPTTARQFEKELELSEMYHRLNNRH